MNAFPSAQYTTGISPTGHSAGMNLRDYFAIRILDAHLSLEKTHEAIARGDITPEETVSAAYEWADLMMEGRK